MAPRWSVREIQYLIHNYAFESNAVIAKTVGRPRTSVVIKAKELGLKKLGHNTNDIPSRQDVEHLLCFEVQESQDSQNSSDVTPCLIWIGPVNYYGYPRLRYDNKDGKGLREFIVSRLMYIWEYGNPRGRVVQHKCKNKLCCEPKHLWVA